MWTLTFVVISCCLALQALAADMPSVVILNSYHTGFVWSDNEVSGFLERLRDVYPRITPPVEYLDAKRFPDTEHQDRAAAFLTDKYRDQQIDLVVCLDNPALDMLLRHRKELFPQVPIVFAGINGYAPEMLEGQQRVTGVPEKVDPKGTLELALALHPDTRAVLVVTDQTVTGQAARRDIEVAATAVSERVRFSYLPPATFNEAAAAIGDVPVNSIILLDSFDTDRAGLALPHDVGTRLLTSVARVPVYSLHVSRLGHGIVGGWLLEGKEHGKRAADIALRVLTGESPENISVDMRSTARPMFDYRQLIRFNIPVSSLPGGSLIINQPESLFAKYKGLILGASAVIIILFLAVIALGATIYRRRAAEEALQVSEERFKLLYEQAPMAYQSLDEKGNFIEVNEAWLKAMGFTKEDVIGRNFADFLHPDWKDHFVENFPRFKAIGEVLGVEFEMVKKDRSSMLVSFRGKIGREPDGSFKQTHCTFQDITEQRRAEERLRESEQRFSLAMEATKDGLWDWNLQTDEVYYSPGYLAMLGYKPGEVPSDASTWAERIHPEDKDAALKANMDCIENRCDDFEVEFRMQAKNGEWRWILERGKAAARNENGRAIRIVGTHTDITERARQTREIKLLNRLYSVLSRVSQAVVRATSPETFLEQACREVVEGGGFLEAWVGYVDMATNAVLPTALWGTVAKYVQGITVYADNRPEGRGPTGTCIRECHPSVHNDFLHDPQTLAWHDRAAPFGIASAAAFPIERAGRVWGALTIYSDEVDRFGHEDIKLLAKVAGDIGFALDNLDRESERKRAEDERLRLEERLQRAEKMEALGTLAGGVAHDLNNVLGIVVGYSELLLGSLDESSSARAEATEIFKGGQRAAAIVQDLLTLARRGVSNRQVLNLNSVIMGCQKSPEFANILSDHSKVRIKTDFEADLLNISGSSVHIAKSFLNLVSNAAEAMPNNGNITVVTCNRYLDKPLSGYDEIREGDYVVLSISDTGEGIPASDMKRIFEPFYTKKVMGRSGTGLGLAVVWGTVKDHHGYINVHSEEGKGTTFTLYFPVTREDLSPENVSVSASEYMGNGESVLVVDDVREQRDLATAMLTKLNYTVVSVSSGEEAVEYIRQNTVDLIVLDMIMEPGMDGLDTYTKILEIRPSQRAIIVSGFSETERVNRTRALGAGAYVKKPYVLEKLGLAIRLELDRPA